MFLRFLHPNGAEIEKELTSYPFVHDAGFKYHPGQTPRFETKAVLEHCELLNRLSEALDNVASKAPLTYQRAHFTSHENPLILMAAERSERRLLGHVLKFVEAKYGAHIKMHQHQLDHLLRNGATLALTKRAMSLMPLPYIDIAILQYCHMLSPLSYIDDITRNINRIHGQADARYENPLPISAIPFPLSKIIDPQSGDGPNNGATTPKNFDLEPLNGRHPEPDYLHWPKGGPMTQGHTRLLDELPERMECTLCARDIYFTQDKGEAWFSFLEDEFVLCRFCGCSNSLSTLRWMSLRDDMASLHVAIEYYRNPECKKPREFPEMPGRYTLGPFYGQHAIDRVLRHSIGDHGWSKILEILEYKLGYEEDWDELLKLVKAIDADLPSTNLYDHVMTSESRTFWQDMVTRYKSTLNMVTTVDFTKSVANLRNFIASVRHLYDISKDSAPEVANTGLISQTLSYLRHGKKEDSIHNPLPQGIGLKYEQFMKLKAKYPDKPLLPTIAIELVWRTHLLYPAYYNRWCLEILNCQVDHSFDKPEEYSLELLTERYEATTHLWWKEYSEEYISPTTDWTQHFTTSNPYSTNIIPPSTRANLTTVEEERTKRPYWAWDHSPAVHLLDSVEQAELYHTLFPTPLHRLLVTTKLVFNAYTAFSKYNPATIWDPKISPLDTYLDLHWDDTFEEYINIITTQPHLTDLFTAQVNLTILCTDILFSHLSSPPTDITHIFQPRDVENDTGEILYQKRLLMWLCIRHSPLLQPGSGGGRRIILSLMKSLHFSDKMKFRVEISPADMETAKVITFLETHYLGAIQQIVRICDPLIAGYIPGFFDNSIRESSETTSGDGSSWSHGSKGRAAPPGPKERMGMRPFHDPVEEEQMRIALGPSRYVRLFENSDEYGFWTMRQWGFSGHGILDLFKKKDSEKKRTI
ncbi:hypothetical protein TWF706_004028 [Orbilia oligospora]|uniref:Uncharacterized protein n=1 Tax=Orbilia oligospora TaxID=2813651 RepID=A0A7C8NYD5_ORBOL|nr:hypothetical protein TWF706_004028 [Orbilia oligospora]KAF3145597.1 hypothetical protein TWF703_006738 [Orbilia oligospora]